jgi:hypothetical protein
MPAAAPATTAPVPPATTAASAFPLGMRFVDNECTSKEVLAVEGCDDFFRFRIISDFGKPEPARLPRESIPQQRERIRLHADFRKQRLYLLFRSFERQIAHVQFLHGGAPCPHSTAQGISCEAEEAGSRPQAAGVDPGSPV